MSGKNVFVGTCGFEARGRHAFQLLDGDLKFEDVLLIPYTEYSEHRGRVANERFWSRKGRFCLPKHGSNSNEFVEVFMEAIRYWDGMFDGEPYSIHIDISSMSRRWYGAIPRILKSELIGRSATIWYSIGDYGVEEFAFSSSGQVQHASGAARSMPGQRSLLVGLGFDPLRTRTIIEKFDPDSSYVFGATVSVQGHVDRMKEANDALIGDCFFVPFPLFSFSETASRLREVVLDCLERGDAILVADGPKPFVFAQTLIPLTVPQPGATCVFVGSGLVADREPRDVRAEGTVVGFTLRFDSEVLAPRWSDLPVRFAAWSEEID